ncbi:MAG: Uma2 family endonuclease [Spirochaetaceae bacterium]|jgi:Uma2 family endonuclease|nr:Uma2 family endonuclease [Spirochaetaceae bacterium]
MSSVYEGCEESPERRRHTYADALAWGEELRAEIIGGEIYMMAPPMRAHQEVLGNLYYELKTFLKGKPCKVYPAPFGVRLFPEPDNSDGTLVEPDIAVVCDESKLDERGCNGAPDLIIEVLSPSNPRHDLLLKFNLYLRAGVREYWIVDPETKTVIVYTLKDGRYEAVSYEAESSLPAGAASSVPEGPVVPVTVLPPCAIDLRQIFAG